MAFLRACLLILGFVFSFASSDALAIAYPTVYDEDGKAIFQPGSSNRRFCLGIPDEAKLTPSLISSARYFAVELAPKFEAEFNKCAGDLLSELSDSWLAQNEGTPVYDAVQAQVFSTVQVVTALGNSVNFKEIQTILVLDFLSKTPEEQHEIAKSLAQKIREQARHMQQLRRQDAYELRKLQVERNALAERMIAFETMQKTIRQGDYYAKVALVFSGGPLLLGRLVSCLWLDFQRGYATHEGIGEVRSLSQFLGTTFAAYIFTRLMVRQDALKDARELTTHGELKKRVGVSTFAKYIINLAIIDACGHWITGQSFISFIMDSVFQIWSSL
jgi:hypothetical protein